jgi:hypothetical protein
MSMVSRQVSWGFVAGFLAKRMWGMCQTAAGKALAWMLSEQGEDIPNMPCEPTDKACDSGHLTHGTNLDASCNDEVGP